MTAEIPLETFKDLDLHEGDSLHVIAETEASLLVQITHRDRSVLLVKKGRRGFPVVKGQPGLVITNEDVARVEDEDDLRHPGAIQTSSTP